MPSINQMATNLIAFAGQPTQTSGSYSQDLNYIWWLDTATQDSVSPLETGAPSSGLFMPQFQGRAPSWSPDGKWIAFESNRAHQPSTSNPAGLYSIFLYEVDGSNPAIQITDPAYNANHAKWYPNGFNGVSGSPTLTVAAYAPDKNGTPAPPYALASLDVSSIVGGSST